LASPQVEFAYNSDVDRSSGKTAFSVVHERNLKGVVDLVELPIDAKISKDDESFDKHIQEVEVPREGSLVDEHKALLQHHQDSNP